MKIQRSNQQNPTDENLVSSVQYNIYAGGQKNLAVGPQLEIIGPINNATRVGEGVSLWIFNASNVVAYVNFYNAKQGETPVAPSSLSNAIPIPPNAYIYLNSGTKDTVTGSANTVAAYRVKDDTKLVLDYES